MSIRSAIFAFVTTVLLAAPAQSANVSVPDGTYDCSAYMPMFIYAGELQVQGNRYRGPSLDKAFSLGWIDFDAGIRLPPAGICSDGPPVPSVRLQKSMIAGSPGAAGESTAVLGHSQGAAVRIEHVHVETR